MNGPAVVILSLALVSGVAFGADQPAPKPSEEQFQVTAEFSAAENTIEELTGTPVGDPDSQAKLKQARAVFQAAVDKFPTATLPLNFLARTYMFPGENMALGATTFEKSLALDPNQPNAIVRLVDLYLDMGQRDKAGQTQAKFVNRTANPELAARVDGLLARWDGKEGQRLVRNGHAEEGFALLDKAMKESSDRDVQSDIQEMRSAVSQEWEITQYNAALEKAKAGDYRGAMSILDKLLPVAKEPEVIQRAKRLHDKIAPAVEPGKGN